MKKRILIDTDVVVDFLQGYDEAVAYLKGLSSKEVCSNVTSTDLTGYAWRTLSWLLQQ